jgi:putative ABC transport system substrate-binding protein
VWAQTEIKRIAFLSLAPGEDTSPLRGRLHELGYIEGVNLSFLHRSAEGDPKRLPELAADLIKQNPHVIVAGWGTLAPQAAKNATATIPIVFTTVGDPLGAGLVRNLARPGQNITGFSGQATELKGKQLQILKEAVPGQKVVSVLLNPETPYSALALEQLRSAAMADGTRLEVLELRAASEFVDSKVAALVAAGVTSLFIIEDPLTNNIRDRVVAIANTLRLPTIAGVRPYAVSGALIAYGSFDQFDRYRRAAEYVDKILKGTAPGDLPVQQPTKFELIVNLRTARAIGLTIPPTLLARADEVIE